MAKNNTNRHYSLRKLKTGTASVAVALTVLGTGLVAGQTVKADARSVNGEFPRHVKLKNEIENLLDQVTQLYTKHNSNYQQYNAQAGRLNLRQKAEYLKGLNDWAERLLQELNGEDVKKVLGKVAFEKDDLEKEVKELKEKIDKKEKEYQDLDKDFDLAKQGYVLSDKRHQQELEEKEKKVTEATAKVGQISEELETVKQKVESTMQDLTEKQNRVSQLEQELATTKQNAKEDFELAALANAADKQKLEAKIADLETKLKEAKEDFELAALGHQHAHNEYQAKLAEKDDQIKQLEEQKQILDASRKGTARDLEAVRQAKKATEAELNNLKAELAKVTEQKQILDASRKGTARDLEAVRQAKAQVEAALKQLEEQNRISEASR
ncbi:TPA: YSIRK-type signal peptide-containing protein, partial [Streptococcus pyogenes MGAS15025]|nr:YSIRK-type signal peptide-containing protein [Streptococcus pyogenes MGAS15025]